MKDTIIKVSFAFLIVLVSLSVTMAINPVENPRVVNGQDEIYNLSLGHIYAGKVYTGAINTMRITSDAPDINVTRNLTLRKGSELLVRSNVTIRNNLLVRGNLDVKGCIQYRNATGSPKVLGVCK